MLKDYMDRAAFVSLSRMHLHPFAGQALSFGNLTFDRHDGLAAFKHVPGYAEARPQSAAAMGRTNVNPRSQGKWIQVSWLTSVTKVSTMGRPAGLA